MGRPPFSTEALMPMAWPLADVTTKLVASARGCTLAEVPKVLATYASLQADPKWVERTVAKLSVPALAVADALARNGGFLHIEDLDEELAQRCRFEPLTVSAGMVQLHRELLAVPLGSLRGPAVALVAPAADHLAALVAGVAAPPPQIRGDGERRVQGRLLVAIAAMLSQVDLKLTRDGAPHRAHVKRLAKQVGLDEDLLEQAVVVGRTIGLLGEMPDSTVRPLPERLAAAAKGAFPGRRLVARAAERIGAVGCISTAALDDWIDGCRSRGLVGFDVECFAFLPGFAAHGPHGERATAISAVPLPDETAATIAPNFEVFMPPETRLGDIAAVLSACEPVRLDTMIVARITKASVLRAFGAGATADGLLAMFTAVSRTPIPQNVEAAVRDWATGTSQATLYTGRVVIVAASDEARLIAALPAAAKAHMLAPGVIAIADGAPERAVAVAIEKHGFTLRGDTLAVRPLEDTDSANEPLPELMTASDQLRRRLDAFCAGDPAELAAVRAIGSMLIDASTPPPRQPHTAVRGRRTFDSHYDEGNDENRLDAELALSTGVRQSLLAYEQKIGEELPGEVFATLGSVLEHLPTHDRRFVLNPSTLGETRDRLLTLLASRAPAGPAAERAFAELRRLLGDEAPTPPATGVEWERSHIKARIEAAARTRTTLLLDTGDGAPKPLVIVRLTMRGSTLFVLGDDPAGKGAAVRFSSIVGVADPALTSSSPAKRWEPLAGMAPPAGHEPCPCGSGKRYRLCCRQLTS